jgi:hypothetical protein
LLLRAVSPQLSYILYHNLQILHLMRFGVAVQIWIHQDFGRNFDHVTNIRFAAPPRPSDDLSDCPQALRFHEDKFLPTSSQRAMPLVTGWPVGLVLGRFSVPFAGKNEYSNRRQMYKASGSLLVAAKREAAQSLQEAR